mgnify:CR=1 FL=1
MAHPIRGMPRPQMIRVIQKQTGNLVTADRMCVFRHVPQLSHFPLLRRIIKKTLIETAIIKPDRSVLTLEDGSHLAFSRRFQILRPVKEMLTSQGKPIHPANQACPLIMSDPEITITGLQELIYRVSSRPTDWKISRSPISTERKAPSRPVPNHI